MGNPEQTHSSLLCLGGAQKHIPGVIHVMEKQRLQDLPQKLRKMSSSCFVHGLCSDHIWASCPWMIKNSNFSSRPLVQHEMTSVMGKAHWLQRFEYGSLQVSVLLSVAVSMLNLNSK